MANRLKSNPQVIDTAGTTSIIKNPRILAITWQSSSASALTATSNLTIKSVDGVGNVIAVIFDLTATSNGIGANLCFSEPWCPGDIVVTTLGSGEVFFFMA